MLQCVRPLQLRPIKLRPESSALPTAALPRDEIERWATAPLARAHGGSRAAPRSRPRQHRLLLAQGVHPADAALPRHLPLLHLRARPARGRIRLSLAGRGAGDRARGRRCRLPGGAVHARRQAGAEIRGGAAGAGPARLQDDDRLSRRDVRAGAARDRAPAPRQSRRDERGRHRRAPPRVGVAGHDAGERVAAAWRSAAGRITARPTRRRRCGLRPSRRRASSRCRSPPAS